ncbi:unnamed protein product [Rotaria sordida]|uniref:Magnesium transporter n=1 Tax=Rotaria sordida TaxID=392033 RepID=A0A814YNA4_9BILA|nr:unnamed protein product [Rotaria sordida]CAF1231864.1 unnamed protein product [Rotaria sordida]CAF3789249.1 unnamed protein product [Rotaria sordida]CAF3822004.1 unnamed protein product [Rotaria sordida]
MINETKQFNINFNNLKLSTVTRLTIPIDSNQFTIGIVLALASSLFIGTSFILKKKGLLKLTIYNGAIRAGSGGFGYLREFLWWAGLVTMGLGELCNFAAYGFAPASVVTPLGALSVLVSALMAVRFLDEKFNTLGKIGCFLTIFGSVIIIIYAPKDSEVNSLVDFSRKIGTSEFIFFSLTTCSCIFCLMIYYGPRLGSKYVHIYILICSLLGAFTITACKGLSIGLKEIFNHKYTYSKWLTFLCAIVIIICVLVQMIYLNRALDLFSTPIVTTIYYVLFTTCVLITSGILFHEWQKLTFIDIMACIMGFLITTCGLTLINNMKTNLQTNDLIFPYFSTNQTSIVNVKQQHLQVKSYANLLVDDDNSSSITNSPKEQRQPMLLIDERDLNF